jgi:hypothetical protein
LISSARVASATPAADCRRRGRGRADSAGTQRGSACSAIWNDFSASALSCFSRNSSPHAGLNRGVAGAVVDASRYAALAS